MMNWNDQLRRWKEQALWLGHLMLDFLREFQRELVGFILLTLSLITLLSLISPATGGLMGWWDHETKRLLGWGSYPAALLVGAAGAILLAGRFTERLALTWQQVVGWEMAFFGLLGIAHLLTPGETPLAIAEAGRGGGYVGWGISALFEAVLGFAGALAVLILLVMAGALLAARVTKADLYEAARFLGRMGLTLWERMQPEKEIPSPKPAPAVKTMPPVKPSPPPQPKPAQVIPPVRPARQKRSKEAPPAGKGVERDPALPPLELLRVDSPQIRENSDVELKGQIILETLANFGIPAQIVDIRRGPAVTQFGVEPGFVKRRDKDGHEVLRKVSVSKIHALSNDLALALSASPIRIEAPVPGRPYVGIEVPNEQTSLVSLRGVMESEEFRKIKSPLAIALGRDVSGTPVAADLASMPHLLIAGATGSGKSVCINAIVTCLLCQNRPETVRLLLVDPKRVELANFNGVPHLVAPVVVDLDQVVGALHWVVREMDSRYVQFAAVGARHLADYNRRAIRRGEAPLSYLVVVVDELADLMMLAPAEIEQSICRIAQMARATGIHLVIATQRPSVDVVTGLIKANFPARISFAVTSQVDSRVVLDTAGAERLLGRGDMLYMAPDSSKLVRLQGCFVSDKEIQAVVRFWQKTYAYEKAEMAGVEASAAETPKLYPWEGEEEWQVDADDPILEDAIALLKGKSTISTSYLQRALRLGYPRAARLMDILEEKGYVGPNLGGGKPREILLKDEG